MGRVAGGVGGGAVTDGDADRGSPPRSRRRWWLLLATAGVLVGGGVVWWATAPDTVRTADHANTLMPIGSGETYYEGYYYLNDRDVVVEQVTAVTTAGVSAEPLLCVPVPGASHIGDATSDDLDEYCSSVEPLVAGALIPGHAPGPTQPYVLLRITKLSDTTEAVCGLDITYRDGWRRGSNRQGGTHQVLLTQDELDPFEDLTELAGCPVRSRD